VFIGKGKEIEDGEGKKEWKSIKRFEKTIKHN